MKIEWQEIQKLQEEMECDIAAFCKWAGVSRTTYYNWKAKGGADSRDFSAQKIWKELEMAGRTQQNKTGDIIEVAIATRLRSLAEIVESSTVSFDDKRQEWIDILRAACRKYGIEKGDIVK